MARRFLNSYNDWYVGGTLRARMHSRPRAEGYPRTHVKRVTAARSLPDADAANASTPVGVIGETPYLRTPRGKTLTYELQQQALTEADLVSSSDVLEGAFSDRNTTGLLLLTPWSGHGTEIWATYARVQDFDSDEQLVYLAEDAQWPKTQWMLDPILSLRQLDGRWLWWNESGTPGTAMVFTGAASAVVTNNGTAPTEPVITVASVALHDAIHIGRDAAAGDVSRSLWFLDLPAGTLTVDFSKRTAKVGSTDVTDNLDVPNSDWWNAGVPAIPPGAVNVWRGPGAGGALTCSFFSASW